MCENCGSTIIETARGRECAELCGRDSREPENFLEKKLGPNFSITTYGHRAEIQSLPVNPVAIRAMNRWLVTGNPSGYEALDLVSEAWSFIPQPGWNARPFIPTEQLTQKGTAREQANSATRRERDGGGMNRCRWCEEVLPAGKTLCRTCRHIAANEGEPESGPRAIRRRANRGESPRPNRFEGFLTGTQWKRIAERYVRRAPPEQLRDVLERAG